MMTTHLPTVARMVAYLLTEGAQQQSRSRGFQGWSDNEAEGNKDLAVANIIANLHRTGRNAKTLVL